MKKILPIVFTLSPTVVAPVLACGEVGYSFSKKDKANQDGIIVEQVENPDSSDK